MSLVINTNTAASGASVTLGQNQSMLAKSLNRLSSGSKIVNPSDDAGGLAVSMKMTAKLHRTDKTNDNVQNGISFLQTQDGALGSAASILDRMSELAVMANDVTKSATDTANYDEEFNALKAQINTIAAESFNGVALFGGTGHDVAVTEDGGQTVGISAHDLTGATDMTTVLAGDGVSDGASTTVDVATINGAIEEIATMRAKNGSQQSRLGFASEMLSVNRTNLEAANSRIIDTDIARESTAFAKANILVQSGTAMLAQANSTSQIALRLIG